MLGDVVQAVPTVPTGEVSTRLVDELASKMGRPLEEKGQLTPNNVWFNASGLKDLCPRLYWMAAQSKTTLKEAVDADLMWTFGVGTGYHHAFQNEFLVSLGSVFQGGWVRTNAARTAVEVGKVRPETLVATPWIERGWGPRPEGWYWKFEEPKARHPELRIVCKIDGVLVWPDAVPEVFELKSIRDVLFPMVHPQRGGRPMADHVQQVQCAMWLFGLTRARIAYAAKSSGDLREVVVEHVVERDETAIQAIQDNARATLAALEPGVLQPGRLAECGKRSDKRPRKCAGCAACFAKVAA